MCENGIDRKARSDGMMILEMPMLFHEYKSIHVAQREDFAPQHAQKQQFHPCLVRHAFKTVGSLRVPKKRKRRQQKAQMRRRLPRYRQIIAPAIQERVVVRGDGGLRCGAGDSLQHGNDHRGEVEIPRGQEGPEHKHEIIRGVEGPGPRGSFLLAQTPH